MMTIISLKRKLILSGVGGGELYLSEFKCDEKGKILDVYKDRIFVGD